MDDAAIGGEDAAPAARWRGIVGVMVAIVTAVTIATLIVMLNSSTRERDAALGWQQHSYEAMILARTLDATMGQSEATLGRFVISGDKQIGRVYFDGWRRAGTMIDTLDREITEPQTQGLIDRLRQAYIVRGNELSAIALRTNYGQNPEALSKYYQAGSSNSLKQIGGLLDRIIVNERRTLTDRTAAADATINRTNMISLVLSAFGLLLAIGAALLGWAAVQAWNRRRSEEIRNRELEYAVADRTHELSDANARLLAEMETREQAEAKLRQVQKMEAVGQLTGGIAHDFNNMLAVVIGGIEMARRRVPDEPTVTRHLDSAMEGANRAATLTKRLLGFARAEPLLPIATDPGTLIAEMSELLDRTIGERIEVRIQRNPRDWPIFVDRHQLENALLNLAVNARDAMENGGVLTVATANVTLGLDEVEHAPTGDYLRISVSDTGIGMARDVQERVFEPFFTTKPVGQGTGLGLSQIFGFVRQSGGAISVDSEVGTGTTVSIFLPRHSGAAAVPIKTQRGAVRQGAAGCTVLVIEDDRRVLAATSDALKELGHRPIPCATAHEAIAQLAVHDDIDLIVSDVLMPGVTGPELVQSIRRERPDIPVLFVTGFAGDVDEAEAFGGHVVLRKPFTINALGETVDRVLGGSTRPARAA